MLKIKLARFGKRKQPHYRIVVNEARDKRDGQSVETIGHYAPTAQPKILDVEMEKYDAWLKKGAQPTNTVKALVDRLKSGNPFPARKPQLSKKAKAKQAAEAEAKKAAQEEAAKPVEPAEAAPAVEAPVTETPTTEAA